MMGEIFERTIPETALTWTGERLTTEAGQQVEVEHLHRYLLARSLCRGLDVLDVASGEGYGGALLAQTACSVVGVELDPDAVKHAQASYPAPNLRFLEGDARHLPLPDASVDVVVSFETIEHFYEHEMFLAEVRRVLRPGGRFIVSSPERDVYSPADLPPNPFHVHELTRAEFAGLLRNEFGHVALLGQRPILGSVLVAEELTSRSAKGPTLTFERRSPDRFEVSNGLPRPVYLLAVASDNPVEAVPDSLYIDCNTIEKASIAAPAMHDDIRQTKEALAEATQYAHHLESELARRERDLLDAKQAHDAIQVQDGKILAQQDEVQSYARHLEAEIAGRDRDLLDTKHALGAAHARNETLSVQLNEAQGCINCLDVDLAAVQKSAERLKAACVARDRVLAETTRAASRTQTVYRSAIAKADELSGHIRHLETSLEQTRVLAQQADHYRHNLAAQVADRTVQIADRMKEVEELRAELARHKAELGIIVSSSIWRISRPLRSFLGRYPRVRRVSRRTAKLAWWTATLQLRERIAARPKASSSALTPPSAASNAESLERSSIIGLSRVSEELASEPPLSTTAPAGIQAPAELDQKALFTKLAQAELQDFLSAGERLSFPQSEVPDVSVVIVLWNQAHLTLRCLRALLTQLDLSIEVILVDNASTDGTGALLSRIDGAHVLSSTTNDGFLLACNRGAAASRGRTLLLLNNDAFLRMGALAAALATLDACSSIGVVGGRLVLPSGFLQEAGSIIWSDASTLGYGRGLAQEAGEAMFRRDVDYCSGAFLLTPLALWKQLGGFDDTYAPAYYEEADYCMRVRKAGYRVVYEPAAAVDHYEFGSETKRGEAIGLMLRNRKRFRVHQAVELRQHHLPFSEANLLAARARLAPGQRRLLVLDNEVPMGSLGAGYPRAREMLREAAAAGWSVTFFPLHQLKVDWDVVRDEIPWEIEIISDWAVPRLAEFFEKRRGYYDAVLVSRPDNMALVRAILRERPHLLDGTRLIYDAEALFSARDIVKASIEGSAFSAAEIEAKISAEVALADGADAIVCVNEAEASIFRARQSNPVHVLSHPTKLAEGTPGFAQRTGFLFVGRLLEKDSPNWQGLAWFVQECWPLICASLPDATLSVVGRLHPEHAELEAPGIHLIGPVANLEPLYASARVFIAPIRFAAGVPIKILEATAASLPTASTRLMARQLAWTPSVDIAAEDGAGALATAATELHESAALWEAMRVASQKRLQHAHSATAFRDRLALLLDGCPPQDEPTVSHDNEIHRVARVEAVWGSAPPQEMGEQWATYPLSHPIVQAAMNRRATGDAKQDPYGRLASQLVDWDFELPIKRAASLCCGAGALERNLARSGLLARCVGYDLATGALEAAREAAVAEGFPKLTYERRDLEKDGLEISGLDLVLAHQGIHHLSQLETVFDAVRTALVPGGVFHLHEFVGPNRFQWSDRQIQEMTTWLSSLPPHYRRTLTGIVKDCAGRASIEEMIAYDPSEAVRSSDIEALVAERFEIVERRPLGGTLVMMALAGIAHNFDPHVPEDIAHLERLLTREEELMASGEIGSDFVVLVARRPSSDSPGNATGSAADAAWSYDDAR